MRTQIRTLFSSGLAVAMVSAAANSSATGGFSNEERASILAYWSRPGSYVVSEDFRSQTPYQVRQTVAGSRWHWSYDALRGKGKSKSATQAKVIDPAWEPWVKARVAYDFALAAQRANEQNFEFRGGLQMPVLVPDDPGPMPVSLAGYLPVPPPFAESVVLRRYRVEFADPAANVDPASVGAPAGVYEYSDRVLLGQRNPAFRFENGVMRAGVAVKKLSDDYLRGLVEQAGLTASEARIMRAVSILEGGFESVNTYDTGYLSVGLIQFAAQSTGSGSLGAVLRRLRDENPDAFQADFRQFGVDVTDDRQLVALDLKSGEEKVGADAVLQIIEDKRLTAVFQRAGERCEAFRVAQLKVAREWYFPAEDTVTFQLGSQKVSAKVAELVRSEAGLATLMEQKVRKGSYGLGPVLTQVAAEYGAQDLAQVAQLEEEVIVRMKDRMSFLGDPTLTQPPSVRLSGLTSRHGTRQGRSGGGSNKGGQR
jgi:predicted flap endonuclease-1-like 5' DNA nuclease